MFRMTGSLKSALAISAVFVASQANAFGVAVSNAPENDLHLTVEAIQSATSSLLLNIYELTSSDITNALIDRIRAGVNVELIEEGQPVGGLSTAAKGVQSEIVQAMKANRCHCHLFEMVSSAPGSRRYRYDHAKYAVIDGKSLLIGSENYSPSGNPMPGTLGNRGWEVWIQNPSLAKKFETVFRADSDVTHGDIVDLVKKGALTESERTTLSSQKAPVSGSSIPGPQNPVLNAVSATELFSPDTSESSLIQLIRSARTSIALQQMTLDLNWKGAARSPLVDELAAAAERGVDVRVLLNDGRVFAHPGHPFKDKNRESADWLNQLASQKAVRLSARIANLKAMGVDYIHNKGALVDGRLTLISSINWDQNSITRNREAAVIIDSAEVSRYYQSLFDRDWSVSSQGSASAPLPTQDTPPEALLPGDSIAAQSNCPKRLQLTAKVGELSLDDSEDQDFRFLSSHAWTGSLTRDEDSHGCVLVAHENDMTIQNRLFFEIRRNASGLETLSLEGYTPHSGKLYSIRSTHAPALNLKGNYRAEVYDGSGPSREKLGSAELTLEVLE